MEDLAVKNVAAKAVAPVAAGHNWPRNDGMELDLGWVVDQRVNLSAAERRVSTLPGRRTVKKDAQAAWLLKAVTCIDLTTLNGDDTTERVQAALRQGASAGCARTFSMRLAWAVAVITTGAVCVYHRFVATAVEALEGSGIPVAAVSTGFPAGLIPHDVKLRGDRGFGCRWRQGNRHRHHPRACADRQLAGSLRRDARLSAPPAAMRMSRPSWRPAT